MDRDKFQTQIGRLGARWPKAHPTEFIALLWREVKDLSDEWLVRTVDELIGSCRQAPLMPDFRQYSSTEKERMWARQKHQPMDAAFDKYMPCDYCRGHGTYVCVRRDKVDGFYAFRCHCEKGMSDPRKLIPQLISDHAKEFVYYDIIDHQRQIVARSLA